MKRFGLLIIVFISIFISIFTSCSIDDSKNHDFYLEVIPIDSVEVPEYFIKGETYQINVTYTQPNTCYYFNDFIYEIDGQQRTIAVVNTVYTINNTNCADSPEEVTVHFNFKALSTETYLFKFYQGEDADGVDQYYLVEVPVLLEKPDSLNTSKD